MAKGERGIWQRRFWEHAIRDEGDYARHTYYVHFNPVKHGYVSVVAHWPHSTFHRWVKAAKGKTRVLAVVLHPRDAKQVTIPEPKKK